jgi:thiamine-monophosphate kinase
MDISDGLALDASRLVAESGVGAIIDLEAVPVAPGVAEVAAAAGVDADVLAATGGEDYELLAAVPADLVEAIDRRLPRPLVPVGHVTAGDGVEVRRAGRPLDITSLGWERP